MYVYMYQSTICLSVCLFNARGGSLDLTHMRQVILSSPTLPYLIFKDSGVVWGSAAFLRTGSCFRLTTAQLG